AEFVRANRSVILRAWRERIGTLPATGTSLATRESSVIEWLVESLIAPTEPGRTAPDLPVDESFSAPRAIAELTLLTETIARLQPMSGDDDARNALHRVVDRAIAHSLARDSDEAARL